MDRALQGRDVVTPAHIVRQLQHAHEHGRHQLRLRDLVFLHQSQEVLGVEMLHDDRGAAKHDRHHVEAQRRRVIERRRRQINALGIHAAHVGAEHAQELIRRLDRIAFKVLLDALGPPGRTGRIQHVIAGDLVGNRRLGLRASLLVPGAEAGFGLVDHEKHRAISRGHEIADLLGAFRRGDEDLGAAILDDVGDLVLGEIAADRGVIEAGALRGPCDLHEGEPVLHQEGDVIAGFQPQSAEQLCTLVGELVELAIGDGLAGRRHLIGDLVGMALGMNGGVGHEGHTADLEKSCRPGLEPGPITTGACGESKLWLQLARHSIRWLWVRLSPGRHRY